MEEKRLNIETTQELTKNEKTIERLTRDKNNALMQLKIADKERIKLKVENDYLKKRNKTLETIEANLKLKIKKYKNADIKNDCYEFIKELSAALDYEREHIDA